MSAMSVNRRSILGILSGAVASGPRLVAGIADAGIQALPQSSMGVGANYVGPGGDWKTSRIKELKHLLSGGDDQKKRRRVMDKLYQADTLERYRLDSLRSVSATHKMRMFIEGAADRNERAYLASAEFELADLLNPVKW